VPGQQGAVPGQVSAPVPPLSPEMSDRFSRRRWSRGSRGLHIEGKRKRGGGRARKHEHEGERERARAREREMERAEDRTGR